MSHGRDNPERISLRVAYDAGEGKVKLKFDIEVWHEDVIYVVVAPRRIPGNIEGCVTFVIDNDYSERVTMGTFVYHPKCTAIGTADLGKKKDTRSMVLGAMHCIRELAETRWPQLKGFQLHDEGSYSCAPLDMELCTTASDILLMDDTFYERHFNMRFEQKIVLDAKEAALMKIHARVDVDFEEFWSVVWPAGQVPSDLFITSKKTAWLESNKADVKRVYEHLFKKDSTTWRTMMRAMHERFGCSFFAATLMQMARFFRIKPILGACLVVDFGEMPTAKIDAEIHMSVELGKLRGGGGDVVEFDQRIFPTKKMKWLKAAAESIEIFKRTSHKYVYHRWRRGSAP